MYILQKFNIILYQLQKLFILQKKMAAKLDDLDETETRIKSMGFENFRT